MEGFTDKEQDLIDGYVRGELSPEQMKFVGDRITSSEEWAAAYKLRGIALMVGKQAFETRMRAMFRSVDRQDKSILVRRWLATSAAAAAVLIMISLYFLMRPTDFQTNAMALYQDFPNVAYPIEKSATVTDSKAGAYQAYELKDYAKAEALFEKLPRRDTRDELFLGLSQLAAEHYDLARATLTRVEASNEQRWSQVADWYMIWVEIGLGYVDEARTRARRISLDQDHRYQKDAEDLL